MSELARAFRVELCGIQKKDRNVLNRIFAITAGRTHVYTLVDSDKDENSDILIVNADDPKAKEAWSQKHVDTAGISKHATILASRNKLDDENYSSTVLPFFPTRLLKSLDKVTETELQTDARKPIANFDSKTEFSNQESETFINTSTDINASSHKKNALIVDDSRPVRKALDTKLRLMDYDVQHAASGREALWLLQTNRFDSVFLDVVMPGMDGYEVCKQIKRNKSTKHIPVIMLTSLSSQFDKVKGKLAGCDTYLTKPIEHEKFEKVVAGFLV